MGRDAELARLASWHEAAAAGRAGVLAIEGDAGLGKTALLQTVTGPRRLHARGSELERGFAFGVARQLFEHAVAEHTLTGPAALAPIFAPPATDVPAEAALRGLYWVLVSLCGDGPLVVAIDDAHWADAETIAWLRYLALRLDGVPAAVVVAARPTDAGDPLAGLLADPAVEVMRPASAG